MAETEITITKDNFAETVAGVPAETPVLVDFWAPWCGPCRMLAPIVAELAEEANGRYIVGKVNVDEEEELAVKYGIMNIPTLIVFRAGEPVKKSVGLISKADALKLLGIEPAE
jgi:thioredoxin 1